MPFSLQPAGFIKYKTAPKYPPSQRIPCHKDDQYRFERRRLGDRIVPNQSDGRYGAYLYRNTRTGVLISSWEEPTGGQSLYSASDIGIYSDAVIYYKNE